jgi:tRNA(Ile)-lysidine synthase
VRVAAAASAVGVESIVRRVDVAGYRRQLPGWSVQQAARSARYQTLAAIGREQRAAAVLVAHTADDQAETVLLNLLRGTGLAGLGGMRRDERLDLRRLGPPVAGSGEPAELRLARPLLEIERATTLAYCTELGLSVVEDASNQSRAYTRNRVRLDLLPVLERFNPAIRTVLARTADLAAQDGAALEALVATLFNTLASRPEPDRLVFDLGRWRQQPRALQRRLLRHGLATLLGDLMDVRAAPIDDAVDLLRSAVAGQTYHLPYGVELRLERDSFTMRVGGRALPRTRSKTWDVEVPRV